MVAVIEDYRPFRKIESHIRIVYGAFSESDEHAKHWTFAKTNYLEVQAKGTNINSKTQALKAIIQSNLQSELINEPWDITVSKTQKKQYTPVEVIGPLDPFWTEEVITNLGKSGPSWLYLSY